MTADERINALIAQGRQTIEDLSRVHTAESIACQLERWLGDKENANAFRLLDAMAEILHLADVIDRMEAALINLTVDRDAWKKRAEAAERDIKHLLTCGGLSACHYCKCNPNSLFEKPLDVCKCAQEAEWRGPCAENGGAVCKNEES